MNVYLESWSPNETLKRFYVKNDIDGSEIGYIQLSYKSVGYGNGYYSEHRAAKGDFGTLELIGTSLLSITSRATRDGCCSLLSEHLMLPDSERYAAKTAMTRARTTLSRGPFRFG